MRLSIALVALALMSAPVFGEEPMARNLGIGDERGMFDPKPFAERGAEQPQRNKDTPPKPRARPKNGDAAEEFKPLSQAERDKNFQRAIKKYQENPEFRNRVHEMYERLRRLDDLKRQQPPEKGV